MPDYTPPNVWICLKTIRSYVESTNEDGKDVAMELIVLMEEMFSDLNQGGGSCPNGYHKQVVGG